MLLKVVIGTFRVDELQGILWRHGARNLKKCDLGKSHIFEIFLKNRAAPIHGRATWNKEKNHEILASEGIVVQSLLLYT